VGTGAVLENGNVVVGAPDASGLTEDDLAQAQASAEYIDVGGKQTRRQAQVVSIGRVGGRALDVLSLRYNEPLTEITGVRGVALTDRNDPAIALGGVLGVLAHKIPSNGRMQRAESFTGISLGPRIDFPASGNYGGLMLDREGLPSVGPVIDTDGRLCGVGTRHGIQEQLTVASQFGVDIEDRGQRVSGRFDVMSIQALGRTTIL
jgi:hypothetical protein